MKPDRAVVTARRLAIMQNPHAARNEPVKTSVMHGLRTLIANESAARSRPRRTVSKGN